MDAIHFPTEEEHPALWEQLVLGLNGRGQLLVLLGSLEWVLFRLAPEADTGELNLRLESGYAALASAAYTNVPSKPPLSLEGLGPHLLAPLAAAGRLLTQGLQCYCALDEHLGVRAVSSVLLARAVVPAPLDVFDEWLAERSGALTKPFSSRVPLPEAPRTTRALLFERTPFDEARNQRQIDEFLRGLDWAANPFLNDPKAMAALGFKGTPYQFPPGRENPG